VKHDILYSRLPGAFNFDAELDLWFSGGGKVRLELKGNSDIRQLGDSETQQSRNECFSATSEKCTRSGTPACDSG
jgi:hypothetical protein